MRKKKIEYIKITRIFFLKGFYHSMLQLCNMPYAHFFSALASNVEVIVSQGGYAILFIFTALEGMPLIGMAVPGHVAVIVAGFFAKIGILYLPAVLVISMVGAVLGDYIGYEIGRKYGFGFIDKVRPYFFITDSQIEKAKKLLAKHTGKAMIIGRFTPATRALIPFLVGASRTPYERFWFFNIIGGLSWTIISVMIGYAFGSGYHAISGIFGKLVLIAFASAILIVWGYRFVNERFNIFRKYELFTLILNIISLYALAQTIQDAFAAKSYMANFDIWVNGVMIKLHDSAPFFTSLAAWISTIGGTAVLGGLSVFIAVWLLVEKKWRSAAIVIISMGSTALLLGTMKEFFMRGRPLDALQAMAANNFSFPSGHAGISAAFFVVIAYLFAPKIESWVKRELFMAFCVLSAIVVGVSRLVLNVHWASDVIAGWSLGVFVGTASILLVRYLGMLVISKKHRQKAGQN